MVLGAHVRMLHCRLASSPRNSFGSQALLGREKLCVERGRHHSFNFHTPEVEDKSDVPNVRAASGLFAKMRFPE